MNRALIGGGGMAGLLSGAIAVQPAIAGDVVHFPDNIGVPVRTEQNFFEEGREKLEEEIERLMQPERETPILTVDDSAVFDDDAFPQIEQLPPTTQPNPTPTGQ